MDGGGGKRRNLVVFMVSSFVKETEETPKGESGKWGGGGRKTISKNWCVEPVGGGRDQSRTLSKGMGREREGAY